MNAALDSSLPDAPPRESGHASRVLRFILALVLLLGVADRALAAQATPGKDGAGGTLTGTVNAYWPGTGSPGAGSTSISLGSRSGAAETIEAGDLLLVIQIQGADIDSTQSGSYGDGVAGEPGRGALASNFQAGTYEYVIAQSAVGAGGGTVTVEGDGGGGIVNSYFTAAAGSQGRRSFQVIRVPQYTTATLSSGLTADAWDGDTGGVLAIDIENTLTLGGNVDVSGLGFRGGGSQQKGTVSNNTILEYRTLSTVNRNASKGEGIAGTPRFVYSDTAGLVTNAAEGYPNGSFGVGAPGNAGGGGADRTGQDHNSGGGGGGNAGVGGRGGRAWNPNTDGSEIGGFGGAALPIVTETLFLGGGGGAGSRNDSGPTDGSGGAGGGIVIIRTGSVAGSGTITSNGDRGRDSTNEGSGGGGSGGSVQIIVYDETPLTGLTVQANGGDGGNAWPTQVTANLNQAHGAGGGGGGGAITSNVAIGVTNNTGGTDGTSLASQIDTGSDPGETNNGGSGGPVTVDPEDVPGTTGGGDSADLAITKTAGGIFTVGVDGEFTISVTNSGPVSVTGTVTVTDVLPAGLSYVAAAGGGWSCSEAAGTVTCTRTGLAAGMTAPDILLSVGVDAAASPEVTNTASVTSDKGDPDDTNNSADALAIVFDPSPPTATDVKPLYLEVSGGNAAVGMSRALPALPGTAPDDASAIRVQLSNTNGSPFADFPLSPGVVSQLAFDGARQSTARLYLRRVGGGSQRSVQLDLLKNGVSFTSASVTEEPLTKSNNTPTAVDFTFGATSEVIDPGDSLTLRVTNTTGTSGCPGCGNNRRIRIFMQSENEADDLNPLSEDYLSRSRVLLATNVIAIETLDVYDAAFPGGAAIVAASPGDTVYLRAEVSDPFGTFDIREASITITDADGAIVGTAGAAMSDVTVGTPATKTFETALTLSPPSVPDPVAIGDWDLLVRADEGVVDEWNGSPIFDQALDSFVVALPDFLIMKSSSVVNDPVNGIDNAKRIPGAVVAYTIQVSNQGLGRADADTVVISDALPPSLELADDSGNGSPITFQANTSGLSVDAVDCTVVPTPDPILYDEGGVTTTTPADVDGDGFLENVTGIVVNPCLRMDANTTGTAPSFSIIYRARID